MQTVPDSTRTYASQSGARARNVCDSDGHDPAAGLLLEGGHCGVGLKQFEPSGSDVTTTTSVLIDTPKLSCCCRHRRSTSQHANSWKPLTSPRAFFCTKKMAEAGKIVSEHFCEVQHVILKSCERQLIVSHPQTLKIRNYDKNLRQKCTNAKLHFNFKKTER